jgi:hypothetical protein
VPRNQRLIQEPSIPVQEPTETAAATVLIDMEPGQGRPRHREGSMKTFRSPVSTRDLAQPTAHRLACSITVGVRRQPRQMQVLTMAELARPRP